MEYLSLIFNHMSMEREPERRKNPEPPIDAAQASPKSISRRTHELAFLYSRGLISDKEWVCKLCEIADGVNLAGLYISPEAEKTASKINLTGLFIK